MIYFIDDKKQRQLSSGWTEEMANSYSDAVHVIHTHAHFRTEIGEFIEAGALDKDDVFLIHDSFFTNGPTLNGVEWSDYRTALTDFSKSHPDFLLAYFSGSVNGIHLSGNTLTLPVSRFYANLECFIKSIQSGHRDLRYLMFGPNPELEKRLQDALGLALQRDEKVDPFAIEGHTLMFRPFENNIQNPLDSFQCTEHTLFDEVEDHEISTYLAERIDTQAYDNIFIPISYGPILSDFNGLRLAMHIRCSQSNNRHKPIYLYSFVDHSYLLQHPLFDLLKTKNVVLIGYSRAAIKEALRKPSTPLLLSEIPEEMRKVHLSLPEEYDDSHRLSNEWAILRWAEMIGISDDPSIDSIAEKVKHTLYFKYLNTIHAKDEGKNLNLKVKDHKEDLAVLFIDDDAHKGWDRVIETLVGKCFPKWKYYCISQELKGKTSKDIEEIATQRVREIREKNLIIILDFRLHEDDTAESNPKDITGVRVLEAIKTGINKGIQVIMFSATDKIVNFEAFRYNADGFVGKESPWTFTRPQTTAGTIESLIKILNSRSKYAYLQNIWSLKECIRTILPQSIGDLPDFIEMKRADKDGIERREGYKNLILEELDAMFAMVSSQNTNRFLHAMIMLYKIYENLNAIFFDEKGYGRKNELAKLIGGETIAYYDQDKSKEFVTYDPAHPGASGIVINGNPLTVELVNSTRNKACFLHFQKNGNINQDVYASIEKLATLRNRYIHPNRTKPQPTASDIESWIASMRMYMSEIFPPTVPPSGLGNQGM